MFKKDENMQVKVIVHSIHFDADQKLLDFIDNKLQKIQKIEPHVTDIQVFLKLDGETGGFHQKIAEIKVNLPGKIIFSKEQSDTFETSVEGALDNALTQIKKHKDKHLN